MAGQPNWNMFAARARSFLSAESLIATTQAAEKWRNSWRDRQRAEAGPAVGVARGQAVVPEPLMAMQYSLARMRAAVIPGGSQAKAGGRDLGLWATVGMIGLIVIVGIYLVTTFIPSSTTTTILSAEAMNSLTPSLTTKVSKKGPTPAAAIAGNTLPIHGESFGLNSPISFFFDGKPLNASAQTNKKGSFDATITIPATQLAGSYSLEAKNKNTGKSARLTVQVLPSANANTNTTPLTIVDQAGTAVTGLTFKSVNGQNPANSQKPVVQTVTIKNTGTTDVQWTVSTPTENGQNWLYVDGGTVGGTLGATTATNGANTLTLNIGVSSIGLLPSVKAYKGYVVFTVDQNQLVLPVSFSVSYTSLELVISPNPLVVIPAGGGACVSTTLTIVNLSNQSVIWNANPDNNNVQLDSKAGQLDPAGGAADTKTINITCGGIGQTTENFATINVYFNKQHVAVPVHVRPN